MFILIIILVALAFVSSSALVVFPRVRSSIRLSSSADDYLEQAKKLREEAASLESSRPPPPPPSSTSSSSPAAAPIINLKDSAWTLQFTLNLPNTLYTSSSTELTFLADGYTTSDSSIFSKVWGWDLEDDDGTSTAEGIKPESEDVSVLLFSADAAKESKIPSDLANKRLYFTAEMAQSKTTKNWRFNKGTCTIKSDEVNGGGLFGLFGNTGKILAQFKVVGRFTLTPAPPAQ
ncbi:hypothetical protein TrST_g2050 [Triparma strigata]|uniref:Uncharacterized protein n=1 Tax=Triparma strigata TaxID=1606541 RepID=A0A9W7A7G3_9STRA|nr:hypothetical protein TrST_g2050 [Triparma strigata]